MCIIVAKKAGVRMPDKATLRNCFMNNPDGAGFMLAAKNQVHGFKGLMTFDEFEFELAKAEKRFGKLDKLAVVMHFRIGTHGSSIAGNTHPFPVGGKGMSYRKLRYTVWTSSQGFAHNGIIHATSCDPDIRSRNVSDTMVFARKYVMPIARHADIASDPALLDMLYEIADSKLCFLSRKGVIATRGDFIEQDGVLYSNTSFRGWGMFDQRARAPFLPELWYDGFDDLPRLSSRECTEYAKDIAATDYGAEPLPVGATILSEYWSHTVERGELFFVDDEGCVYYYDEYTMDLALYCDSDEFDEIVYPQCDEP